MIFKAVSGAKERAFNTFNSGETLAENDMSALDVTNQHLGDYKNRIILKWAEFAASEVTRVLITLNMRAIRNLEVHRSVMYPLGDKSQL